MRRNFFYYLDLLLVLIFTILAVVFILTPVLNVTILRTIFALFMILFLPGYAFVSVLFSKKGDLSGFERLALSIGLSVVLTPFLGLALNYTSFGIRLDPVLLSLSGLTIFLVVVAFIRRLSTFPVDRFWVDFGGLFKTLSQGFSRKPRTAKILSAFLIVTIILAISLMMYIIVEPKMGESFTEFYILGQNGTASYPTDLISGESENLIIGIVNHENKVTKYHLVVTTGGVVQKDQIVTLANGNKMEIPFKFTANDPGTKEMKFLLYKLPDDNNIYRSLQLWINISQT